MNFYSEDKNRFYAKEDVSVVFGENLQNLDISILINDYSLYPAYYIDTSVLPADRHNPYIEKIEPIWQKVSNITEFESLEDVVRDELPAGNFPYYFLNWDIVPLSGQELIDATDSAQLLVSNEVERRLAEVSGWRQATGYPETIDNYATELLNLTTDPNYPAVLALEVDLGIFINWPEKPPADEIQNSVNASTVQETNADIAFRQIVLSYSIPGSYPDKVTAMDNAVTTYTVDGSVTDLYSAAVTELQNI